MPTLTTLEKVKIALGTKSTGKDDDRTDAIAEAMLDMEMKGIDPMFIDETNEQIMRAIKIYVAWTDNLGTVEGDRFRDAYESYVAKMSMSENYRV